VIWMM
jgi:hypothetical protein